MAKKTDKKAERVRNIFNKANTSSRTQWERINQKGYDFANDNQITEEADKLKRTTNSPFEKNITTKLKHQIISVNGETNRAPINHFVDNQFLSLDTKEFRAYQVKMTPDIIFEAEYTSQIGEPHTVQIPIGVRFFWPESRI